MNTGISLMWSRNIYRTVFFFIALLLAVGPVTADEGKKLTNAELKKMTSSVLFYAGHSYTFGIRWIVSLFPNGTRELYWNNGEYWKNGDFSAISKGKWWIDGDRICNKQDDAVSERCNEWRQNGDRFEIWLANRKTGYFCVLK